MDRFSLPGITKIHIIRCEYIDPGAMFHSIGGCVVAVAAPSVAVEFIGRPVLKWEGTMVNGSRQEKSTLEFSTMCQLPEGENLAFVVTAANGAQKLIGTREGRYPIVSYSESTGDLSREAAVRTYKITHIAEKSVLPCVL